MFSGGLGNVNVNIERGGALESELLHLQQEVYEVGAVLTVNGKEAASRRLP
jgi:hypothetical protein